MILYRKMKRGTLTENIDPHFKPYIIKGTWKYEEEFDSELEEKKLLKKVEGSLWSFSYKEEEKFVRIGEYRNVRQENDD